MEYSKINLEYSRNLFNFTKKINISMKNYTKQIQELRDEMHKEIIREMIKIVGAQDCIDIELKEPFMVHVPNFDGDEILTISVFGIEGDCHKLLTRCITGGAIYGNVDYQDLELEHLDYLYKQIVTNQININTY